MGQKEEQVARLRALGVGGDTPEEEAKQRRVAGSIAAVITSLEAARVHTDSLRKELGWIDEGRLRALSPTDELHFDSEIGRRTWIDFITNPNPEPGLGDAIFSGDKEETDS